MLIAMRAAKKHVLTEIDEDTRLAFCLGCDTMVKLKPTYAPEGRQQWRCKKGYDEVWARIRRPYKLFKKESCEECGFFAKHPAQLHVDHIDGDKKNNDPSNLQTLCANCHAYKTAMKADWIPKKFSQPQIETAPILEE